MDILHSFVHCLLHLQLFLLLEHIKIWTSHIFRLHGHMWLMATILERVERTFPLLQKVLLGSAAVLFSLNPGSFWPLRGGEWHGWSSSFWITKGADFSNSWGLDRKYLFVWLWKSFPLLLPQAGGFPWHLQTQSTVPQGTEPTPRPQKRKFQSGGTLSQSPPNPSSQADYYSTAFHVFYGGGGDNIVKERLCSLTPVSITRCLSACRQGEEDTKCLG